jgi:Histidine kinase-, DNA gyrase B-, and HSP90-like ATPase
VEIRTEFLLINLIDNAIKFTPAEGSVTVQASRVPTDMDFICVSVVDSGSGITPEARSLIFERLYQDPNAVDNNRKGLGLGLFIAKELVMLHGGRIWVASDGASGSTFSFTLPLYSLAKLLLPVITEQNQLRNAITLVRVTLRSKLRPPRGNWKEICKRARELVERCVFLDKDLVLPQMTASGSEQTLLVVASTNEAKAEVMMMRIREQLEKVEEIKASTDFAISATGVPLPDPAGLGLEQQVAKVAESVTELARSILAAQSNSVQQTKKAHN